MIQFLLFAIPGLLLGYGVYELVDDDDNDRTDNDQTLTGDEQANDIDGKSGNDLIAGLDGNDNIQGGSGNDTIDGGAGDDVIVAEQDNDVVSGGEGNDLLLGGTGDDAIDGGAGEDWVEGDAGNDTLDGGADTDLVIGGEGSDDLSGGTGDDALFGGTVAGTPLNLTDLIALRDGAELADVLNTTADSQAVFNDDNTADTLSGGEGDDLLILGADDTGSGGEGADTFAVLLDQADAETQTGGPALITDLADDDALVLMTNDNATPDITVVADGEDAIVSADGEIVARVTGAGNTLTAAAITIIPAPLISDLDPNR